MTHQIYIHVGMPKTGTTFLQKNVFPQLENIEYWEPFKHPMSFYFERFSNNNYLTYPTAWKESIKSYIEKSENRIHILSYEGFFGSYTNNYKSNYTNSLLIKDLFPEAKIILSIRSQISLIESNYSQVVSEGFIGPIHRYINYHNGKLLNNRNESNITLNKESLLLHKYLLNYNSLFGTENVLVIPYELLTVSPMKYVKLLSQFLNIPETSIKLIESSKGRKRSLSPNGLIINRILNRIFICDMNNGVGFIPKQPFLNALANRKQKKLWRLIWHISRRMHPPYIASILSQPKSHGQKLLSKKLRDELRQYYRNSNLKSEQIIGISLTDLGY